MSPKLKLRWVVILGIWVAFIAFVKAYGEEGGYTVRMSSIDYYEGNTPHYAIPESVYYEVWWNYPKAVIANYLEKEIAEDEAYLLNHAHEMRMEDEQPVIREPEDSSGTMDDLWQKVRPPTKEVPCSAYSATGCEDK